MKRPTLYERTNTQFWTDSHISSRMLEAHLNPDTDAASRKPEFVHNAVEWIASLALPERARLLDIGCGPGLYTKRLAEHGLEVTGIDFSERSIAYAKEHDQKSEYDVQDYLAMKYESAFDIVTLIYCDYGALIPGEREELLHRIHKALKPDGLFLFDVFTPLYLAEHKEYKSCNVNFKAGFWSSKPHICMKATYIFSGKIDVDCYIVIDKRGTKRYNIWNTCFTKQSLSDEIVPAGFIEEGFFSDVTGKPYTDDSQTICAIYKKV